MTFDDGRNTVPAPLSNVNPLEASKLHANAGGFETATQSNSGRPPKSGPKHAVQDAAFLQDALFQFEKGGGGRSKAGLSKIVVDYCDQGISLSKEMQNPDSANTKQQGSTHPSSGGHRGIHVATSSGRGMSLTDSQAGGAFAVNAARGEVCDEQISRFDAVDRFPAAKVHSVEVANGQYSVNLKVSL